MRLVDSSRAPWRALALGVVLCACAGAGADGAFSSPSPSIDGGASTADATTAPPGFPVPGHAPTGADAGAVPVDASAAVFGPQTADASPQDAGVVIKTTIYAHTDTALYALDPATQLLSPVGLFTGLPDASYDPVTDLAVNASGTVYVNTESAIYVAQLPAVPGPFAAVSLTWVAPIGAGDDDFYALAFAPAGALGQGVGEVLVGGDEAGQLWSIDPATGAAQDLGGFGPDPARPGNVLALSGDLVFYTDASGAPAGLATIRSCEAGASGACLKTSDMLAGIDMPALAAAYASKSPAPTLLSGIYGAGAADAGAGAGTGYGELFGLGAWGGSVYAFSRNMRAQPSASPPTPAVPPLLLAIDTTTGVASPVASMTYGFTDGWSGAGVTTQVTVTVPKPPPVPQ